MKYVILGLAVVVGLSLSALAMLPACSGDREPSPRPTTRLTDPSEVSEDISQELMIALGQAKNYHRKAKIFMTNGNLPAAIAAVRQVLSLAFPKDAAEAEDVRNDARALLAKLLVRQGQLDEAMQTVDEGLAQSKRESFFVANLHTVQGEIHEARAAAFDAAGESGKASAVDERRAAIASYDRSIQINERLQKKLLEEP